MNQRTTSEDQYAASTQPQPVRPRLALRVGVTGTRAMPDEPTAQNHVASAIRAALEALRKHTFEAAVKPNIEPPRVCRRLFCLSYAAMAGCSSEA